ncbi:MAG: hypothetical protein LUG16_07170 [Candidatus Gastranaerophilales bacterium]|nr:hypothetical protein [Candidatus Gastranaerophilales bacterium]
MDSINCISTPNKVNAIVRSSESGQVYKKNQSKDIFVKSAEINNIDETKNITNRKSKSISDYLYEKKCTVFYANKAREINDKKNLSLPKYYQSIDKGVKPAIAYSACKLDEKKYYKFNQLINKKMEPTIAYKKALEFEDNLLGKFYPQFDFEQSFSDEHRCRYKRLDYNSEIGAKFRYSNEALKNFDNKKFLRFNQLLDKKTEPDVAYSAANADDEHYNKFRYLCAKGVEPGISDYIVNKRDCNNEQLNTAANLGTFHNLGLKVLSGAKDISKYKDLYNLYFSTNSVSGYTQIVNSNQEELENYNNTIKNAVRYCQNILNS